MNFHPSRALASLQPLGRALMLPIAVLPIAALLLRLKELGLISMEVNDHEYRFKDIIDLDTREVLFTVEHEVRSQTHPLYGRPLVNRNPRQSNSDYKPGHDSRSWAMA